MAATKVYKETDGKALVIMEGTTLIANIEYPGMDFDNLGNVILLDFVRETSYILAIADVRDSANAAIGGQTASEVRIYIDAEMAK